MTRPLPARFRPCSQCGVSVLMTYRTESDQVGIPSLHDCLPATPDADDASEATDPVVERVATELLLTDALTANHDGTPEYYIVDADNVSYLVRTVLDLTFPADPDAPESEWIGPPVEQPDPAASTGASEGLSEAEREDLYDLYYGTKDGGRFAWTETDLYDAVERIVADHVSAAATQARAEERERIAQEIEAACCSQAARIARGDA